jgi:hypothetical protein
MLGAMPTSFRVGMIRKGMDRNNERDCKHQKSSEAINGNRPVSGG